jgi:hypothetical protein
VKGNGRGGVTRFGTAGGISPAGPEKPIIPPCKNTNEFCAIREKKVTGCRFTR